MGLVILALPLHAMPNYVGWPGHGMQLSQQSGTSYKWWFLPEVSGQQLRRLVGAVELPGLRGQARVPRVPRHRRHDGRVGEEQRLRSRHVGARGGARPVRHADGADAVAVLDRRLHRFDGGPVLRGVVDHAVPLHQPGRAVVGAVERPTRPALRRRARRARPSSTRASSTSRCSGVRYYMAISDRMIDFGRRNADLTEVASVGTVGRVRGGRLRARATARQPARRAWPISPTKSHGWLDRSMDWYMDPEAWSVVLDRRRARATGSASSEGEQPEVQPPDTGHGLEHRRRPTTRSSSTSASPGTPVLGQDVVLPELEGERRRRTVAGDAEPDGRGARRATTSSCTTAGPAVDFAGWGVTLAGSGGLWSGSGAPGPSRCRPSRRDAVAADPKPCRTDPDGEPDPTRTVRAPTPPPRPSDGGIPASVFDPAEMILPSVAAGPARDRRPTPAPASLSAPARAPSGDRRRALSAAVLFGPTFGFLFDDRRRQYLRVRSDLDVDAVRARPRPANCRLSVVVPAFGEARPHRRHDRAAATWRSRRSTPTAVSRSSWSTTAPSTTRRSTRARRRCRSSAAPRTQSGQGRGGSHGRARRARAHRSCSPMRTSRTHPTRSSACSHEIEVGWDVVTGSRRHTDTTTLVRARRLREIGGRAINALTRAVLLGQYRDTQCGLKAFRSDVAQLIFRHTRIDGFAFDVEVFFLVEQYHLSLDRGAGSRRELVTVDGARGLATPPDSFAICSAFAGGRISACTTSRRGDPVLARRLVAPSSPRALRSPNRRA